jgi:Ca2+-binding RTX toxin-like protein
MASHISDATFALVERLAPWRERPLAGEPVRLGPGDDRYAGLRGVDDVVYGQGGDDNIQGVGGNDVLRGGAGDDFLSGGKNRDRLFGGDGNDDLDAGGGNDVIVGGAGTDQIGLGTRDGNSDRVVFKAVSDSLPGTGHDTVFQFASGEDRIDLRKIDADASTPDNDAFHWIGREAFGGVAGELRYEQSTQLLQGDVNGDGLADFEVFFASGIRVVVTEADIIL